MFESGPISSEIVINLGQREVQFDLFVLRKPGDSLRQAFHRGELRIALANLSYLHEGAVKGGYARCQSYGALVKTARLIQAAQNSVRITGAETGPGIVRFESQEPFERLQRFRGTAKRV